MPYARRSVYFGRKDDWLFNWGYNLGKGKFSFYAKTVLRAYLNKTVPFWLHGEETPPPVHLKRYVLWIGFDESDRDLLDFLEKELNPYQLSYFIKNLLIDARKGSLTTDNTKFRPQQKTSIKAKVQTVTPTQNRNTRKKLNQIHIDNIPQKAVPSMKELISKAPKKDHADPEILDILMSIGDEMSGKKN